MARGLPISTFVDISTSIAAGGVLRTEFGTGLLVTTDSAIAAGGPDKAQLFADIAGVNDVFDVGDALDAATVWFSADPPPKSLYIGRWATSDVSTTLRGATPGAIAAITVSNASFSINGQNVTVNLSAPTTYAAIATAIQSAIVSIGAPFAGATFTYATNAFLLTITGAQDIGFFGPHSAGTGTNIATLLGMTRAAGATYRQGHDEEEVVDAIGEMVCAAQGGAPVALMLADDAPLLHNTINTREAVAAYAQAGDFVFGLLDTSAQALVSGDATSQAALAFERQQSHVEPVYSMAGERPDIGLLALMSSQNLNLPASIITPHLKSLPSVRPTIVTENQRVELERKRTNVYTTVGGLPSLVGGFTGKAGSWLDAIWWLLWLKNEMELNIFNAQRASRRFNTAILSDVISQVLRTAVQSGGANPGGRVNAGLREDIRQTTGNMEFDGFLTAGHITWIESPSARSDLDRENRIGRFKTWVAPADAIHRVTGDIVLSG